MHVIHVFRRHEGMQRRVDGRRARIQVERAMRIKREHAVFIAVVSFLQRDELLLIQRREVREIAGAQVAARATFTQSTSTSAPVSGSRSVVFDEVLPPPVLVMRWSAPSLFER